MTSEKVFIIAEAGVNHNGDYSIAEELVRQAADAGVDAVKFQTFIAEEGLSKHAVKAEYQEKNEHESENQLEMCRKLELNTEAHYKLKELVESLNMEFMSTAFDLPSMDLLLKVGVKTLKVPSGDITNLPLLQSIGKQNLATILSTGMATMDEIAAAVKELCDAGLDKNKLTILHCNTEYPTPYCDVNLRAMYEIRDTFKTPFGYSDHTLGIEVPIAAVAMGATVIEKHFTLDQSMTGPDHAASLNPTQLKQMVASIRNIEASLGSGRKTPSSSEAKNIEIARRSLTARKPIKKGETFTLENVGFKRPGNGVSPMQWPDFEGKTAPADYEVDDQILPLIK